LGLGRIPDFGSLDEDVSIKPGVYSKKRVISIRVKLSFIRRILPSIVEDHVKLFAKFPCLGAITSSFL
jgi:hypothetical protein